MQATGTDAKLEALHLDLEERQEAEYHLFLASVVKPVEDAVAALRVAAAEGTCSEWAVTHRETLVRAAEALRDSHPPRWLAVYRNSFLGGIELFLTATDYWQCADAMHGNDCAERAARALAEAEDITDALL